MESMKKDKKIVYNITEEQIQYIQDHTFNMVYDSTLYWLFSERMSMYYPFLIKKKRSHVSLEELLQYCKNQQIQVYPMPFRKNRILTKLALYREFLGFYKRGILIKSHQVAMLINEYAKYCIVNFPVSI